MATRQGEEEDEEEGEEEEATEVVTSYRPGDLCACACACVTECGERVASHPLKGSQKRQMFPLSNIDKSALQTNFAFLSFLSTSFSLSIISFYTSSLRSPFFLLPVKGTRKCSALLGGFS